MRIEEARARIAGLTRLHAFISVTGESGPGTVVAVKDLIDVRGVATTAGGRLLPSEPAREDAPVIRRLRERGCVMVGKTNLHEFAYGVTSENVIHGDVLNPRDEARVAGGSSGGSAVAVATDMCDWAIGTDTGGSIRIPAALCGVVGIKPTMGLIETTGVVPLSPSLDTLGPLATDVSTAAAALELMSGRTGLVPGGAASLSALRLAVPAGWVTGLDGETEAAWRRVGDGLPEIPFPDRARMNDVSNGIMMPEASHYHRHWVESCRHGYGDGAVLERLVRGLAIPAVDYLAALRERDRVRSEAEAAMRGWDALLLPATAEVAPPIGAPHTREPLARFTRAFNATGQPVVCIPAPASGLPVGIQVIGHIGDEAGVIRVAHALETAWRS
ncbi:MAG: amidase [Candidatus Dormibacteraceae bacterium]